MLGFLSVSTCPPGDPQLVDNVFQSRAGFSECLDVATTHPVATATCFNPVLGFLSVSTSSVSITAHGSACFNPVLGFLSVSTVRVSWLASRSVVSIPCWVF